MARVWVTRYGLCDLRVPPRADRGKPCPYGGDVMLSTVLDDVVVGYAPVLTRSCEKASMVSPISNVVKSSMMMPHS